MCFYFEHTVISRCANEMRNVYHPLTHEKQHRNSTNHGHGRSIVAHLHDLAVIVVRLVNLCGSIQVVRGRCERVSVMNTILIGTLDVAMSDCRMNAYL